ncbi:MAG TPA: ComEA family DNA-binding protein [Egibacteraceae bacterium]|nr:ComEA family DNA-binding protein [Egibacteraceae bacterium]
MGTLTDPHDDAAFAERLRRGLAGLGCSPAELAGLVVLVAGAVAALVLLWVLARPGAAEPEAPAVPDGLAFADEELVVHVAGAVAAPGLYRLPGGARVADALEKAGGPLPDALLDALNLARPLTDGEQLLVPGPAPAGQGDAPAEPAAAAASPWRPDGRLDLNRATPADLEQLPGIGPVLAERIAAHRDQAGGFTAVGDLRDVPGIGEKKFQAVAELVAV